MSGCELPWSCHGCPATKICARDRFVPEEASARSGAERPYSTRRAVVGSVVAARYAGIHEVTSATPTMRATVAR